MGGPRAGAGRARGHGQPAQLASATGGWRSVNCRVWVAAGKGERKEEKEGKVGIRVWIGSKSCSSLHGSQKLEGG